MDDIINSLNQYNDKMKREISYSHIEGYKEGFGIGFKKGFELSGIEIDNDDIDISSIKLFAEFCYINGIDFSYMSKAEDTVPFTERVINKFKESLDK